MDSPIIKRGVDSVNRRTIPFPPQSRVAVGAAG
jgi:hypothetical protein